MVKRGKMIYVPKLVFGELDDIMIEDGVNRRAEALEKMSRYSKIGRQVVEKAKLERITVSDLFSNTVNDKRRKQRGGLF